MAEVVGGHNEVLNNEALTAHATAITAIITIKLSAHIYKTESSECVQRMQNGKRRWVGTNNPLSSSLSLSPSFHGTPHALYFSLVLWPPSKGAAHLI